VRTAAVLLAAGRASRFGSAKLTADLGGRALGSYAAETIAQLPLDCRVAVVVRDAPDLTALGFDRVALEPVDAPLSRSLALGVVQALEAKADRVLIALADMPFVPLVHFKALLANHDDAGIATSANGIAMPPAVFGPALLPALLKLQGDQGARTLLQNLPTIALAPELAIDIDRPSDLEAAEDYLRALAANAGERR
jgi:molybdenum cofactor cytidylyltransferase